MHDPGSPSTDIERSGTGPIGDGAFTPQETSGLRQLFGQGPEGARRPLDALDRGRVEIPAGVGLATLERFERIARGAIGDGDRSGTQALRLQAVAGRGRDGMLRLHEVPPKDEASLDPASAEVLADLWAALGVPVDRFFLDLYRAFGGRSAPDAQRVTLWPVARVVAERALATTIDGRHCHAIGDVMIDSDSLMVCPEDAAAPAYLRHAGDRVADTAVDLVEAVVAGRLAV